MASSDISVGMKVSGVSSFVTAMKQSRSAVKELDAEMALSEAQYEASGNAEERMAKQTDILKKKMEEQRKAVEECKRALEQLKKNGDSNTEAFKSWETALVQNQTALLNTQNKLNNLAGGMNGIGNAAKTGKGTVDDYGKSLKNIATITDFSAVKEGIQGISGVIETAISSVVNLGKKLWNFEAEQSYLADDLMTRATKFRMSTTELQQWEYAARFVDTEVSSIITARSNLQKYANSNEFNGTLKIFDRWDGYVSLRE